MLRRPQWFFFSTLLLGLTGALLGWRILPAARSLTGDAPLLLSRSRRIYAELLSAPLEALSHLSAQVVPQPPMGHLIAGLGYGLGLDDGAPLLAAISCCTRDKDSVPSCGALST